MVRPAPKRLHGGPWAVGRQVQLRQLAVQLLHPVFPLPPSLFARQHLFLPGDVVGVLDLLRPQRRVASGDLLAIEGLQFVEQQVEGPEVERNVVHHKQHHRFLALRPLEQQHAG